MSEDRFGQLLGPYLLGELSGLEGRELERHLEGCPGCRHELDHLRETHALLQSTALVAPSPELKARVLARATNQDPARSRSRWVLWGSTAAALLVAAVLGVGLFRTTNGDSTVAVPLAATAKAPGAGALVRGEEVGENFRVELEVWGMPELEEDEYYEMWYYADDGGRISCGTFRVGPEGRTTVNLTAPANAAGEYPEIEITREPGDGDPRTSGEEVLEGHLQNS